jgi:hypothetical protein
MWATQIITQRQKWTLEELVGVGRPASATHHVMSRARPFICGLYPPQPHPTPRSGGATFTYNWRRVKDA